MYAHLVHFVAVSKHSSHGDSQAKQWLLYEYVPGKHFVKHFGIKGSVASLSYGANSLHSFKQTGTSLLLISSKYFAVYYGQDIKQRGLKESVT